MEQRGDSHGAAGPGPRTTLRVFGSLRLSLPAPGGDTKLGRKEHALLAYLALHAGQPQPRAKLAGLLWGNILEESARQDLRQALSKLRQALGDHDHALIKSTKVGGDEAVLLDANAIEVDANLFEELAQQNDRASLEAAAALYAGDLLEGLDMRIEGFENWLSGERARLRHLAVDTLVNISKLRADANETQAAIDALHAALRLDPLREDACRQIMLLYTSTSRRSAALQEYANLRAVLQRELQTEPEPETSALAESIRRAALVSARITEAPSNPVIKTVAARAKITAAPEGRTRRRRQRRIVVTVTVVLLSALTFLLPAIAYWRIPELAPAPIGGIILYVKEGYLGRQITPELPSIAVLPFTGHGDADAVDYAEAISEGTASTLSIISEMRVVPQLSVRAAMGDSASVAPSVIAQRLGVRYLLEGEVLKSNNSVSVTINLIDTAQGDIRALTKTFSSNGTDIIVLQRAITLEIITELKANLTEGEQERINRARSTPNVDASVAAAHGEKMLRRLTREDNLAARQSYEEATKLDSAYAGAWDGLAWTYLLEARFAWTAGRAAALKTADDLAQKALALDANRPQTFSLLGALHLAHGDHAQAIDYGEQAVTLEANDADAAALLAYTYTYAGQPERAAALVKRAIALRPYPPEWYLWLKGRALRQAGRYDEAIRLLEPAANAGSPSLFALVELAAAYSAAGQSREAKAITSRLLEAVPQLSSSGWVSLVPYRDPADAEAEIALLKQAGFPD